MDVEERWDYMILMPCSVLENGNDQGVRDVATAGACCFVISINSCTLFRIFWDSDVLASTA